MADNKLYYGDNLQVLAKLPPNLVDLIYLDPPFNSARNYNVIFSRDRSRSGHTADASAQIEAFEDTWTWTPETDSQYDEYVNGGLPVRVADALSAMRTLLGENDASAYLVNMAPRLVELHRVLKPTGSLYLHCDPTMSHYLKVLLDGIFDVRNFKSEIIWKRTTAHNSAKRYGPVHDVILYYAKDAKQSLWNKQHGAYDEKYTDTKYRHIDETGQRYRLSDMTGSGVRNGQSGQEWRGYNPTTIGRHWAISDYCRTKFEEITGQVLNETSMIHSLDELDKIGVIVWPKKADGRPEHKRYLDDMPGVALQDVWTDIDPINARAAERLGYPTQKPLALMERIITASSNPGDVVLDPFCGCGTTVDAAQKLGRSWIGVDITYIAIDLIEKRLLGTYGPEIADEYVISGIPHDKQAAFALFKKNPFDFERWAVSMVNAQPNAKQVGDRGIDGVARFPLGQKNQFGRIIVSVKGGTQLNPAMVRDLLGTVQTQGAEMGILITMGDPTRGMIDAVNHAGSYLHPANNQAFPRLQIVTVPQLLSGNRPSTPATLIPYIQAKKSIVATSVSLFDE